MSHPDCSAWRWEIDGVVLPARFDRVQLLTHKALFFLDDQTVVRVRVIAPNGMRLTLAVAQQLVGVL